MARIDELVKQVCGLVKQVCGERLRGELELAVKKLRKGREFGLVFEEHVPEVIALPGLPLRVGGWAQMPDFSLRRIVSLDGDEAEARVNGGGGRSSADEFETGVVASDLTPVARFWGPIYPTLDHLGSVETPHFRRVEEQKDAKNEAGGGFRSSAWTPTASYYCKAGETKG